MAEIKTDSKHHQQRLQIWPKSEGPKNPRKTTRKFRILIFSWFDQRVLGSPQNEEQISGTVKVDWWNPCRKYISFAQNKEKNWIWCPWERVDIFWKAPLKSMSQWTPPDSSCLERTDVSIWLVWSAWILNDCDASRSKTKMIQKPLGSDSMCLTVLWCQKREEKDLRSGNHVSFLWSYPFK